MNSQTEINTINLKNYIDKKVVVYHRNLKKVEGYMKYNNQFPDYPYKFNDRCYTKNGKILIDNENGWDICEIFPTTEEIDPSRILKDNDFIWYMGEKYQKVEDTQPFYDKLWGLLSTEISDNVYACDDMADKVRDLIREHIPKYKKGMGLPEYCVGWNDAIKAVNLELFNGIL